jgi:hypothetical protein
MANESLVRKNFFLTSEQSECFASLSIDGAKYIVLKVHCKAVTVMATSLIFDFGG